MIKINDYATKNHLNEWEIKKLPDDKGELKIEISDKGRYFFHNNGGGGYRLDLTDNNFDLLLLAHYKYFKDNHKVFLPNISKQQLLMFQTYITGQDELNRQQYGSPQNKTQYYVLCDKTELICDNFHYITPDWSEYIAKDNAVLFLSEEDYNKYKDLYPENYPSEGKMFNKNQKFFIKNDKIPYLIKRVPSPICEWGDYTKVSIILPSIHSKNIQEISNIAKDLKEDYGVEYVEVVATHRFIRNFWDEVKILKPKEEIRNEAIEKIKNNLSRNLARDIINGDKSDFTLAVRRSNKSAEEIFDVMVKYQPEIVESEIVCQIEQMDKFKTVKNIDRLITTDSTGVIKIGDYANSKVIDCQEFFINFLPNDKS